LQLIDKIEGDILYLDPPYNSRQYSSNHHLLNTIAKYDMFTPKGITGQRNDNFVSPFSSKRNVYNSFEYLIKNAKFKYIFLSYNNEGILSIENIKSIFTKYGKYDINTKECKTYKADCNRNNKSNTIIEYLHILTK